MDQETGRLYFDVLLNDESLQQGLQRSRESFRSLGESANAELQSMDGFMAKAAQTAAGLFAVDKIKDFVSQLALVRGEYQQLEVAFETMLGSKSKADALMGQLIDTAATTPFEMSEVAEASKMLLAYGMEGDKVNETLIRLGDIAAGLSMPLKDLAFLYGTTMVQGRLYTQDLNQFLGRGIPLADELAKQFGKNKSEVKKLVEEGKIGFPEVQKAIEALTGEGSKFGGLMEKQSKTIKGQLSNIEDAWEQMFNEIGKSQEGNISGVLDITGKLIENWRTIGKVVLSVVAIYGSYKAATMVAAVATRIAAAASESMAYQQKLAAMQGIALSEAQAGVAAASSMATGAFNALKVAFASNPFGLIITAITTVITLFVAIRSEIDETTQMSEKFGESAAKSIQQVESLSTVLMGLDEGTGVYKKTMEELNTILEDYGVTQIKEGDNIDTINKKRQLAIELIKNEGIERQRLNAIQTANDEYEKAIEERRKEVADIFKSVDIARSGRGKNFRVDDSGWMKERAESLSQVYVEILRANVGKGEEEIDRLFRARLRKMKEQGQNISESIITGKWESKWGYNASNALKEQAKAINELNEERNKSIDLSNANAKAAKEEADAHESAADRVAAGQRKLLNASKTADELYNNVARIVKDFADNTLNFHINFDGEPPAWMLKMDFEETRRLAAWFTSKAEEMRRNNQKVVVFSNGKTMSVGEMAQEGLYYSKANQAQAARQEAARKKAEEAAKKKKKSTSNKSARTAAENARKKAEDERKRIALEKHDLEKDIEKYKDSIIEKEYESSLEIRQNKINLLEDGYEKERQQIELNYERLLFENKKRSDAMVEAIKENKMREWKIANPKATKEQENAHRDKLKVTKEDFDPSQRAMLAQYESVAEETRVKASGDLYKRAIAEFQDYDTRRTEIAKEGEQKRASIEEYFSQYARELQEEIAKAGKDKNDALAKFDSEAHTAAEKREKEASQKLADIAGTKERALEESKRKQEKDIKAVNDEEIESTKKTSALFVNLFGDAAEKSRKELHKVITETESLLAYLRETSDEKIVPSFGFSAQELRNLKQAPEKVKEITDQLKRLKDAVKAENPFVALSEAINEVFRKAEQGESLPALEVRLKKLASAASATADVIAPISAKLSAMFEAAGSQT